MSLTFGSLFSGIGGLDLGLERAGMTVRWQVENDDYCNRVLAKHWPDVPRYGDIKELNPDDLEPVDLIAGGFPCQPVSLAGKGLAQQDERWLWPHFARVVRHLRPRYVLVENVPGLLVRGMGDVLGDLATLGFDAEWQSIPAAAVGAPHLRWRVFLVAYARCIGDERRRVFGDMVGAPREREGEAPKRQRIWDASVDRSGDLADTENAHWRWSQETGRCSFRGVGLQHWRIEPDVGRVAHGVPHRLDRLRGLGNAVVPQVAEGIGRRIVEFDQEMLSDAS